MITSKKFLRPTFMIFIWLISSFSFGQTQKTISIKEKVLANGQLFQVNIDKAFLEIDHLLKETIKVSDSLSELKLLERKCLYYYNKEDVDNLIVSCKAFQKKAIEYANANSQAMSHVYLAETFSLNSFHDRAIKELDKALRALEKVKDKNLKYVYTKANVLISQGNIYNDKGDPKKAAEKLMMAIKNYESIKDPEEIQKLQYLNYANLASIYTRINFDSAHVFAMKSINLKPKSYPDDDRMMGLNYLVLGKVSQNKKEIQKALEYYLKAEEVSTKRGESLNIDELYNCIISTYSLMDKTDKINEYKQKLKEHELTVLKSKYNSLHKVMENTTTEVSGFNSIAFWIVLSSIVVLLSLGGWLFYKKNGVTAKPKANEDKYEQLLKMIKTDDPAFLFHFEDMYPDFKTKILNIEPNLSLSDIEFCILLRLNLSTKKIAQLKFLEVRTVQNKKYRIRKRLNIPQEASIYNWFSEI